MTELRQEPAQLMRVLPAGIAILAAALTGLGIIFWIAANWDALSRAGRFALLEGVFAVMCLGAWRRPGARVALGVLALLCTGGLLAFFGQTYQTGADPWQLFAWWTVLTLPLCLGIRHDAPWTAWGIVALTALTLWARAQGGHGWNADEISPMLQLAHLAGAVLLTVALSPLCRRFTGAGDWSMRVCLTLTTILISFNAIINLFDSRWYGLYVIGLLTLAAAAAAFSQRRLFDMFAVSALGLGLNAVIDAGLARALLHGESGDQIPTFLLLGLVSAGLLAGTVKAILTLSANYAVKEAVQ